MKLLKMKAIQLFGVFVVGTAGLMFSSVAANATPMGHLDVANCGGGGVTVNLLSIDWTPAGGTTGCIITGAGTNVTFTGGIGTLGTGVMGTINDLPAGTFAGFMNFPTAAPLVFDLIGFTPGAGTTNCTGLANFGVCSVNNTSPFVLELLDPFDFTTMAPTDCIAKPAQCSTSILLQAFGTVTDGTTPSNWNGQFTVTITGQTPATIQSTINGGGSINSTFAGDFGITIGSDTPEPSTWVLSILGLGVVAFIKRKSITA